MTAFARGMTSLLKEPSIIAFTGARHGLGNRVRVVLGSRVLARVENRSFAYTWPTGPHFGAQLDQLWDFNESRLPAAVSRLLARRFPYRDHELRWLDDDARAQRLWQIRTPHAIILPPGCPPWEAELRTLVPSRQVATGIQKGFTSGPAGRPYVGVMIRTNANAHEQTLMHSPLEWYLTRMREIRELWPEVPFYVSADTTEAFLAVSGIVDNCFGSAEKGAYNSEQALVASVIDLYMLASSSHLLGPHYSSFPELAQRLAGSQLRLETSMSAPESALKDIYGLTTAPDPTHPFNRRQLG